MRRGAFNKQGTDRTKGVLGGSVITTVALPFGGSSLGLAAAVCGQRLADIVRFDKPAGRIPPHISFVPGVGFYGFTFGVHDGVSYRSSAMDGFIHHQLRGAKRRRG
jgi:hypothetical protein